MLNQLGLQGESCTLNIGLTAGCDARQRGGLQPACEATTGVAISCCGRLEVATVIRATVTFQIPNSASAANARLPPRLRQPQQCQKRRLAIVASQSRSKCGSTQHVGGNPRQQALVTRTSNLWCILSDVVRHAIRKPPSTLHHVDDAANA